MRTTKKFEQVARSALLAGGEILMRGFRRPLRVAYKTKTSPVTQVDIAIERAIRRMIHQKFPNHRFIGEESDFLRSSDDTGGSSYRWIVDPLDGTVNFIHRFPHSSVSVALEKDGRLVVGGVYDPFRKELFFAVRGEGATLNGRSIHVSKTRNLNDSLLITGFPYDRHKKTRYYLSLIEPFMRRGIDVRRIGSAALDLAWIAAGRADGYWESRLNPWDVAAGALILEEAGGKISNFSGTPYDHNRPYQTLASNGRIHRQMQKLLR